MQHSPSARRNRATSLFCSIAVVVGAGGLTGCGSTAKPQPATTGIVIVGDSLMVQAVPYLQPLIGQNPFVADVFGGTAPCDWLTKDLQITSGSMVVISFDGNSSSPCMSDGSGGYLTGQSIVDKYRTDISSLIALVRAASAAVLVVGQPMHADSVPGNDIVVGLNSLYAELVDKPDVAFVDAGAAVENADGSFANALPCLAGEAQCDPSGFNVIRNDDGLHFCPGPPTPGPCTIYSSGAFRFAHAIAEAIAVT